MSPGDAVAVDAIMTALYEALLPLQATVEPRAIEIALVSAGFGLMVDRLGMHAATDALANAAIAHRRRLVMRAVDGSPRQ